MQSAVDIPGRRCLVVGRVQTGKSDAMEDERENSHAGGCLHHRQITVSECSFLGSRTHRQGRSFETKGRPNRPCEPS